MDTSRIISGAILAASRLGRLQLELSEKAGKDLSGQQQGEAVDDQHLAAS